MYSTLLFDMDGTLIDSEASIWISLCHALEAAGQPPIPRERTREFIGPPLDRTLSDLLGLSGETFQRVWDGYAAHYRQVGLYGSEPVPGMPELVARLKKRGFRLAVATCKPWDYCGPILELCGFGDSFEVVAGSFHNGVPENKAAVIRDALRQLNAGTEGVLMVGDRAADVAGSRACGTDWSVF